MQEIIDPFQHFSSRHKKSLVNGANVLVLFRHLLISLFCLKLKLFYSFLYPLTELSVFKGKGSFQANFLTSNYQI